MEIQWIKLHLYSLQQLEQAVTVNLIILYYSTLYTWKVGFSKTALKYLAYSGDWCLTISQNLGILDSTSPGMLIYSSGIWKVKDQF